MCEFRTVYDAPPRTEKFWELGYVYRCVNIGVSPGSTRTRKDILFSFSYRPTCTASLRSPCRVAILRNYPNSLSFVFNEVLKLSESPTMQASSDSYLSLDIGSNIGQVFHANLGNSMLHGFRNNGLAYNVVNVFHMPLLTPRDFAQFSFGCAATVGLKSTTMCEISVSLIPKLFSSEDLSSAGCGEIVLANIDAHYYAAGYRFDANNLKEYIEIPNAFPANKASLFRFRALKQRLLVLSIKQLWLNSPSHSKKRHGGIFKQVGSLVKINGLAVKQAIRWRFCFLNFAVTMQCLVSICNTVNRLANHLASKCRESFSHLVIDQVMQSYAIPTPVLNNGWHDHVTSSGKLFSKNLQRLGLLRGRSEFHGDSFHHIGYSMPKGAFVQQQTKSTPFLPMAKARGFLELSR